MAGKSVWMWVSVALLCSLIIAIYGTMYYYNEYLYWQQNYEKTLQDLEKFTIFVNILIDYGNGTKDWYNNTRVPLGSTLLNATQEVAEVDYVVFSFGVLVTEINGKSGSQNSGWVWYIWNSTSTEWEMKMIGADAFVLHHEDIVKWLYIKW